jgi:hypothetical protein
MHVTQLSPHKGISDYEPDQIMLVGILPLFRADNALVHIVTSVRD